MPTVGQLREALGDEADGLCACCNCEGVQGSQGAQGAQGNQGSQGAQGAQGDVGGAQGNQGAQGGAGAQGFQGAQGNQGPQGFQGAQGAVGQQGSQGNQGAQGGVGAQGFQGNQGAQGFQGAQGGAGPQGFQGGIGAQGAAGATGGILAAADFFALMGAGGLPDNPATIAPGTDVSFPQDGPTTGPGIVRLNATQFRLVAIGIYDVQFQVSVTEAGQLVLTLNGAEVPRTVVGRATGTSQIVGVALLETTVANSVVTVRNPAGETTALTITPLAGGTNPVSAHLRIARYS